MDELAFKRHLRDLAHGHHHPEEHDWGKGEARRSAPAIPRHAPKPRRSGKRRPATAKKRRK